VNKKKVLFCNSVLGAGLRSAGEHNCERIAKVLEGEHQVTTMPNLNTAVVHVQLSSLRDFYDFAVIHLERSQDCSVVSAMNSGGTSDRHRTISELIPYVPSIRKLESMRRAQPHMQVILYGHHNPVVVRTCFERGWIDFYTRAEGNKAGTLDDEIKYIQRYIAGQVNSKTNLSRV